MSILQELPIKLGSHASSLERIADGTHLRKRYGEHRQQLDYNTATFFSTRVNRFTRIAREDIGIRVPLQPSIRYLPNPNAEIGVIIEEVVPYVGPNIHILLQDPTVSNEKAMDKIGKYLDLFRKVKDKGYPISLDPSLANFCEADFCEGERGKIWYVDTWPPRQLYPDGTFLSEFPEPPESSRHFIEARYFGPLQNQVIYAQLLYSLRTRTTIAPSQIKEEIISHLGGDVKSFIDFTDEQKSHILSNPHSESVDALRIIAGENYHNDHDLKKLEEVYRLTHIGAGGILPPIINIEEVIKILQPLTEEPAVVFQYRDMKPPGSLIT